MVARTKLSPIEYTVLGIAWKRGPCTTYALMKEMSSSTSTFFKNRASTIYPLVERLIKMGLLAQSEDIGARGERSVVVTESGIIALKFWLTEPLDFGEVAHTVDFVRLRTFYLGAAKPEQRAQFLASAMEQLEAHEASCQRAIDKYKEMGDAFSALASEGVLYETRARKEWLTAAREQLLSIATGKPPKQ
jgi:DNA-binding PadR family transcriptional regulator